MEKLTYSVSEAAEVLGISRRSMYKLIHREDFHTVKAGSRRLISRKFLAEWVDRGGEAQAGGGAL